ncbi:hypothetical protein [Paraburkholderia susongensis]|uniref:Uncharacterized protein n=1 Tax=Paraburkholderia susongensis TaxID=1515439 RepID=A0A1X7JJL9_9BURK|nr:hypothetical protein [Paraburkholderia susongensis]SMG28348.1 hypothetical protein SAMN06265784_102752 [Paraburkholderia susongensis]
MSKQTKRAKRVLKRAQRLENRIDVIIGASLQELEDSVSAAEQLVRELEMDIAAMEAQDIPLEARH